MSDISKLIKENSVIKIRVHPNAKKTAFKGVMADGVIKIDIAVQPEKGKANQELIKYLANELNLREDEIKIISGQTGRVKKVKINC